VIKAHSVILSAASPVFETALRNSKTMRIKNWKPEDFEKLVRYTIHILNHFCPNNKINFKIHRFIYSGGLCFGSIEEACALLKLASSLALEEANEAARDFISQYMYSEKKVWTALQCAREASDETLIKLAEMVS
jgi:hypothetical protein